MDMDGDPTKLNPKAELGRWSPVVAGVFLIVFNVATVVRLRVRYIFMFNMSWKMLNNFSIEINENKLLNLVLDDINFHNIN